MWVDNQGIRTKLFDKEILFEFANPIVNSNPCDHEINLVGVNSPPKILETQLIHNLIINDILSIHLCISKFQTDILNQGFLNVVFTSEKTIKYIAFKYNLTNWIILNPNFQIKGESFIPNHSTRGICRVHETMAPKKSTQAPNQKTQPSQAPSPHKMLWSQQVEEEEARLHSSNLMHNKMMTLYYDHSDLANPVKTTQYPAISRSLTFK